jgi:anti-sigma regulatory factor (Ser/Thr protein kinase)
MAFLVQVARVPVRACLDRTPTDRAPHQASTPAETVPASPPFRGHSDGRLSTGPASLSFGLPAEVVSVPASRRLVATFLAGLDVDDALVSDAELVVSELVTNAVGAAGPVARVHVHLRVEGGRHHVRLRLEVVDDGPGFDLPARPELPGPGALSGRGLPIVATLGEGLSVQRRKGCTVVTTTLVGAT